MYNSWIVHVHVPRIVMYNPDCHVQSWLLCTIPRIVMYNPDCQLYNPQAIVMIQSLSCHVPVPRIASVLILIVMYNPD